MNEFCCNKMSFNRYILTSAWAMSSDDVAIYRASFLKHLQNELVLNPQSIQIAKERSNCSLIKPTSGAYEMTGWQRFDKQSLDDAGPNTIAVVPFTDAIMKYDQECGPDGVLTKMRMLQMAENHSNVKAHVLLIDSGGGEAMAMLNTADFIKTLQKPVVAFVDDYAASAAYGIASSADYVIANRKEATIGSIGTMATFVDPTGWFEKEGFKVKDIYADNSSDKNSWYRSALDGDFKPLTEMLNKFNGKFISLVNSNRGDKLTAGKDVWGTGKTFSADEALSLGLIDDIGSLDSVIQSLINN